METHYFPSPTVKKLSNEINVKKVLEMMDFLTVEWNHHARWICKSVNFRTKRVASN